MLFQSIIMNLLWMLCSNDKDINVRDRPSSFLWMNPKDTFNFFWYSMFLNVALLCVISTTQFRKVYPVYSQQVMDKNPNIFILKRYWKTFKLCLYEFEALYYMAMFILSIPTIYNPFLLVFQLYALLFSNDTCFAILLAVVRPIRKIGATLYLLLVCFFPSLPVLS